MVSGKRRCIDCCPSCWSGYSTLPAKISGETRTASENLTLTERIEIDLGAWLAVTVILGMNTWYFNESDVGMMAALLLAYIVCGVINGVPLGWWILWKARQSERLDSGIVPELRRTFCYFSIILSMGATTAVATGMAAASLIFVRWIAGW